MPSSASATTTVNCAHHQLQHAIDAAPAGSTVLVSGTCVGQFVIAKDLTLQGDKTATIDGDQGGPTITVQGGHAVTLSHLTVTGGMAKQGGGISATGHNRLVLSHLVVTKNAAFQAGGGIAAAGTTTLSVRHSAIRHNVVQTPATPDEGDGLGGGIYAEATTSITGSDISHNRAIGATTTGQGEGKGGAIYSVAKLTVATSTLRHNVATGIGESVFVQGGAIEWLPGGTERLRISGTDLSDNVASSKVNSYSAAFGGALYLKPFAGNHTVTINGSTLNRNQAVSTSVVKGDDAGGGAIYGSGAMGGLAVTVNKSSINHNVAKVVGGNTGAHGGGIALDTASLAVSRSTLSGNVAAGHASILQASSRGGAIDAKAITQPLKVVRSTIAGNLVSAQSDDGDALAGGGGIGVDGMFPMTMVRSTVSANTALITSAATASSAYGGGLDLGSSAVDRITNSTISGNSAATNSGATPTAAGGGIAAYDLGLAIQYSTIAGNSAAAPSAGSTEQAGGLLDTAGTDTTLLASILAKNTAATGADCDGPAPTTLGFNLIGSASSCAMTLASTDLAGKNPKVKSLAANGGATKTMALAKKSPAINRVPAATCHLVVKTDQRGVKRPHGKKCDAGAFELT